ncbi:hypothetical protein FA13DRAFT_1738603 [Coprinellus micaceus]|uniref:Secreted protein n=1 Tax=Coprinellus micaceus TaxID=71717 RepID=A0A4Y7STQ3_COPMI|nr:hypothetical protein FA13DRAFT_1738603 [Coprinellus micaceus]
MRKLPAMLFGARNLVYLHLAGLLSPSTPAPVLLPQLKVLEIHDRDLRLLRGPWGATSECTYFPFTISAPALDTFDLAFSVDGQRPLNALSEWRSPNGSLNRFSGHSRPLAISFVMLSFSRLSRMQMAVCLSGGFLGHRWDGRNGTLSGQNRNAGPTKSPGNRKMTTT